MFLSMQATLAMLVLEHSNAFSFVLGGGLVPTIFFQLVLLASAIFQTG